jgi:hypothetical protein
LTCPVPSSGITISLTYSRTPQINAEAISIARAGHGAARL